MAQLLVLVAAIAACAAGSSSSAASFAAMGIAAASMPLQFSGKRARAVFEEDAPVAYLVELDRRATMERVVWWEKHVPDFTDKKFQEYFRVSREAFNYIMTAIQDSSLFKLKRRGSVGVDKLLAIFLYVSASPQRAAPHSL